MTQEERLTYLIDRLLEETDEFSGIDLSKIDRHSLLRSLMNRRMPRKTTEEFLMIQDKYLKEESKLKGIVVLENIPTIKEQLGSEFKHADKISIWQGDITRLKVGAIVNAANSHMLGCFVPNHKCIDNAIHSAAGVQLRNTCFEYMQGMRQLMPDYEEPTGQAFVTRAYNLPCDYVIHTVGPIVYGSLTKDHKNMLSDCYRATLNVALEKEIKSLAFCCISTGEYKFPNGEAARIAINVVKEYLDRAEVCFDRIIFNVFKDEDQSIYESLFNIKVTTLR